MHPEYTNPINTVRHPHFGILRIIYIEGQPWICLTDINRILASKKSSWGEALLFNQHVQHASGLKFVHLSLPTRCLAAPRNAFVKWLLSIVLTGGRTGPTPFREHPGPHQNVVGNLAVDASWLYAFTDRFNSYVEWLTAWTDYYPSVNPDLDARAFHLPNRRIPLVAATKELIQDGNLEMSWVAKMIVTEAMNGWHTQDSLDHAMAVCSELLPNPPDRIDARSVHAFLEVIESFPVWFNEQVYRQELFYGKDYFTSDDSQFLPTDEQAALDVDAYFSVETTKDIMLQARTPRGSSTRQYFIGVAKKEKEQRA